MRFQKEINIFAKDAILKRFQTNETNFSVVKGKIEALISESEILELQNSKVTMYSKLVDVKLTVDGLEQTYTDITSKYDAVSGKYTDLDAKVAEYKSGVDGMSQNLSQVQTNLRDNYSTTATMNATIQAKIDGLSSTISQTYATGSDVQQKLASADATAKGYADAAKQEAVDTAQASTKELLKSYATGYLAEDDQMNGKPVPGMYAEDVAKYYPVGAYNNEEGLVENWNERMIIPAMLKLLQNLYKRIS